MKTKSLIGTGFILLLMAGSHLWANDRITAFMNADGKIVFTNLAGYTSTRTEVNPGTLKAAEGNLDGLIEAISARNGVDPSLVRAVIRIESNFDHLAVSNKGALGLMQLIPATGERFGVHDFFDPAQNIEGGVRYLRFLLEKFRGNLDLSLAAYNSGENRVARLGRIPRILETQNYVRKVRSAYRQLVSQARSASFLVTERLQPAAAEPFSQLAKEEADPLPVPAIYQRVDGHGIKHFSNVSPDR